MRKIKRSGVVGLAACCTVGYVGAFSACRTTEGDSNEVTITVWTAEGDAEFMKWAQEELATLRN